MLSYVLGVMIFIIAVTVIAGIAAKKSAPKENSVKRLRWTLKSNMALMGCLVLAATLLIFSGSAFAADDGASDAAAETEISESEDTVDSGFASGMAYLAAALSTGLATIGAGIAVAVAGSAALGAISEDPKLLGKTLIFVGLAEGIAIYGLIISIMILNRV